MRQRLRPEPHPYHRHQHPHLEGGNREQFIEFIRHVSPDADPTSVMLFGQIQRANNRLTQAAENQLAEAGLSWAKFRFLMSLRRAEIHGSSDGLQPSELSEIQGISRNTASALIAALEEESLVSRELHGQDRRKFVIRLTPQGRQVLKAKLKDQFKFVSCCFDTFDSTERNTLLDMLFRLNQSLDRQNK